MRTLRAGTLAAIALVPLSAALAVPASAATQTPTATTSMTAAVRPLTVNKPQAPFPSCGDHFGLTRQGSNVKVTGVDLRAFSSGYMLVWPAANGKSFGPFNASPYGGANFTINTGSSSRTTVSISLTDADNTVTLCASDYTV